MHKNEYNTRGKTSFTRMRQLMYCIGHELVHVKQYLNNELLDYADGERSRFKGNVSKETNENYWDMPYEIEAYGREQGLFKMFKKHYQLKKGKKG